VSPSHLSPSFPSNFPRPLSRVSSVSSLDDPDTTYRTREEIEQVRNTRDPIHTLRRYIEEHNLAAEQELRQIEKDAKDEVDAAVAEAKESPDPAPVELWSHVYAKGNEPPFMRGRERMEVSVLFPRF
jgi:pyruvate dehydrogenase E1 component alpha subunit